jgi:hypothetical protein
MNILEIIRQIDWAQEGNRLIGENFLSDALEYMKRVEAHIYKGNEIRADMFMGFAEKQDEISRLDRKRTEAHDKMLNSFSMFLDLLRDIPGFIESKYNLSNRTRIADFTAMIAFELIGIEPSSRKEGEICDELAEKLHQKEITYEQINAEAHKLASE